MITLVSTRRSATARRLFDDPGYPWWLGRQVALLSAPDDPPPLVEATPLLALLEPDWATTAASLVPAGVQAVVRAGSDGDVLGLLSPVPGFEASVVDALRMAAKDANLDWIEQDEFG